MAAVLLLSVMVGIVVLYPEAFITGGIPVISSSRFLPSHFMAPIMAAGTGVFIFTRYKIIKPSLLDAAVLAFFAYLVVRNIAGPMLLQSIKYTIFGLSSFYLATGIKARGNSYAIYLLWVLTALTAVTVIYGLIEYLAQTNIIYQPYILEYVKEPLEGVHRIGSTLAHPVSYAGYLVQAIPFCILAAIKARSRNGRLFAALTAIMATLALFLTYSKGSWIVALVMVVAGVLFLFRRQRRMAVIGLGVVLVTTAVLAGVFWRQINLETSTRADSSVEIRLASWRGAVAGIQEHPLLGVGLEQGQQVLLVRADPEVVEIANGHMAVDNFFLNILLEEGVVGTLLWLVVLVLIIKEGVSLIRRHGPGYAWGLAAMASIVGILLNCMTYDALVIRPHHILFWISAGLIHGTVCREKPCRQEAAADAVIA